ncbi:ProQ/FINO family protein [Salinicola sp. MIT1003]|uniref:ProQ/FINO family protein n=1 Tax=Salinicola sp. MIT1003 TaxID=1882734 RepID=UPI000A664F09|nr:ProQ/FINO family protein [Salinicola sp. MIT1003]
MLTDRTQALLAAIEHQVEAGQAALEAEKERCRALEAENRALKERLLALAELDPMVVKGHDHSEDPDGGSRARGLGNLAFRRPRPKEGEAAARSNSGHPVSPLQRLTSAPPLDHSPSEPAQQEEGEVAQQPAATRAEPPADDAASRSPATHLPASSDDPVPAETRSEQPQNSLAFGAEHEAPSPHALLAQWYKRYPRTFFKGHTRPLKTGIHLDLCEVEPWPEKLVRRALACYVHLPRYLKSVREGARRVDMAGEDCELVTADEAKHAKRQLEALQKKQKARETQQRSEKLDRKIGALLAKHGQRPQE